MTQETKIGLAINQGAMLRNLRFAFANHDTVVQELVQNARRAGALSVDIVYQPESKTLTVTDDGIGITDFQLLLQPSASGWSQEVQEKEPPAAEYLSPP